MNQARLLVIDDDAALVELLQSYLSAQGYEVVTAVNGRQGLRQFYETRPDLVLLDVTMPEMDGWETLRRLRELSDVPIIMLTVRGEEADVLRGFTLGADDYVTKPFSFAELGARVRAVLSRAQRALGTGEENILQHGDIVVNLASQRVTRQGKPIPLTPTEYKLLLTLMQEPGRVFSPEEIVRRVWGPQYLDEVGYVRRYIWFLRQKIEPDPRRPRYILNNRGFGYYFQSPNQESSSTDEPPATDT